MCYIDFPQFKKNEVDVVYYIDRLTFLYVFQRLNDNKYSK